MGLGVLNLGFSGHGLLFIKPISQYNLYFSIHKQITIYGSWVTSVAILGLTS